ncbi:FAD-dependent tricarballylate dehydrogenase TcuA [Oceanobacillus saliphilus]|uniref:FAD-dependent tricarballylate dehydrogenase TcuA n=1 Tax=Oceanobacillus saliphilus TaxID=2925834 RepID=UPI00201DC25D|nr:FAD-dependent tricarballylate dehydrogenase TcuA [Oceanobacillus saliphilus]
MVFYDVVVVGAGNAALCAAISAREQGAKVLVLEKAPLNKRGGNSFFTDGAIRFAYKELDDIRHVIPAITEDEAEKIVMPPYTEEEYYADLMRVTKNESDPELAKKLVSESYDTISWMKNQGVSFDLIYDNQSFVNPEGKNQFWGGLPVKIHDKGIGLVRSLFNRVDELGIDVWYEAQAVKLNQEDKKVTSIIVNKSGDEIVVPTKSVVLACGSFEANKEMRMEYLGEEWKNTIVRGTEYNTGDGITMALEVGAQTYGQWTGCHSIGTDYNAPKFGDFEKPGDIFKRHSYPLGIMLNKEGKRFVDEGNDFRNYTYAKYGREVLNQPEQAAYQIFDSQVRLMLRNEYNLEEATFYEAVSLEELVEKLPVNQESFKQTIYEYNKAVQDGDYDPAIKDGKGTEGLNPNKTNWALKIENGPFYAFPVTCGITFTFGGLRVNTECHVLSKANETIEGLFAAGEMVGGIFYHNYPGGSGLMSGAVFGKQAGLSAALNATLNEN